MTQKRRLATYVRVAGRKWGPDDEVPDDVATKITNPKVWADPADDESAPAPAAVKRGGGTRTGARLATYVHVGGRRYGPDDTVPDRVARLITNPKAWEGGVLPDLAGGGGGEQPATGTASPTSAGDEQPAHQAAPPADPAPAGAGRERMAAPRRAGRGSGLDAWQAFAVDHDVEFADGASRDDIIAACEQAGVIPAE